MRAPLFVLMLLLVGGVVYVIRSQRGSDVIETITQEVTNVVNTIRKPRGVRANNPLNIESNVNNNWLGKVTPSVDSRFETFQAPEYGFRAGAKLLRDTYQGRYGLESIRELIHKFAPSHENNSDHYAEFVAKRVGVSPDAPIDLRSDNTLARLIHSMSIMEVGRHYTLEQAQQGVQMA
ncbi:structural protein [Vibrio sp. MarTm2]|uniref:structural protein n=1 Tax=Vibrio sp. MarTm2 TaxID=2998831 RepID=UPI0022CD872C|nr:structural protein [Vibrio sp. MarTm2]MDA0130636.1 structural protein [Vibrio sp. MarTm2]